MLWQRAVQVSLYFICGQSARAQRLFHQLGVIAGVSGHVVHGSCRVRTTVSPETHAAQIPAPAMFYLIIHIECVLSTRLCQQGADTADELLHIAERLCCINTWKQHPQLSSQGLGNTANNQVSCLPGEEHTRAASVLREMDVPRLLLHLFFKLSHTQTAHVTVLLFMLHYAVKTGCISEQMYTPFCFTSTPELIKHPQARPPSGRFIASMSVTQNL